MASPAVQVEDLGLSYGSRINSFSVEPRSGWRVRTASAALLVATVALVTLLALSDGQPEVTRMSLSASEMNGGTGGMAHSNGDATDFIDTADLGDYVDAIIGPAPSGLTEGGYKKRGSIAVSKIDASGFYYLNIQGEPGHALKTILQGSDGYHRHWKGYGQIYTGPIHEGNYGGKDYLQIQDLVTGEVEYFRFRFT
mmetsp:Transcript_56831/g.116368  ORF Transcript_56831/g.116368 Transcript_56831/m.116368 type:complete len:196 (+) Transcript_56831:43-630(+)